MLVIYVGDAEDVVKRIRTNHCSGNVEASVLRKHVASHKGYTFSVTKRASGSRRIRLDLPDPRVGEQSISNYIRSGLWKFVVCRSCAEANNFQWYVIDKLNPVLNVDSRTWDGQQEARYADLLMILTNSSGYSWSQLAGQKTGPGVYVLYHNTFPYAHESKASSRLL